MHPIWERICQKRVIPVVVIDDAADAVPLARALKAGGLDLLEITFRTAAAAAAIRCLREQCPEICVGAGTLLSPAQLTEAHAAGAAFGVAPGLNDEVVRHAASLRLPFMPGVATPSEVERALQLGCTLLKLFPADVLGGVKLLKAFAGPYGHTGVRFVPLGGINATNAADYLALPLVAAVGGSWIAERSLIANRNWGEITARAASAVEIARSVRIGTNPHP